MAGFGGSVKLTGESEYKKALAQISQELKVVSAEMKATSSSFANGDKSTKELATASTELSASLEKQKSALSTLKSQLATMSAEYAKTGEKHKALVDEYNAEKQKLDEIGRTLGTSSTEYKNQQKVVSDLGQEVDKSSKSLDAQGKSLNNMRIQTANAETTVNQTAKALDDLGNEAEDAGKKAEKSSDGFTVMKGVLANLATQAISSAINGLKNLGSAFVDVGKQALDGYAEFEQLEGGVKKIFGDDMAQTVIDNANKAFSTAGMSANEYMETVTGFSSSLIQSLDGDTAKATEISDRAIRDMSDNANTFGTSMESIQYAYQGFAKQNYTMLDNLKLGYGGTKEEMQRLIADASKMTDVQKELGITVDESDMSFANVANAISVVQKNMGIMGTTAKEASGTIEGSTGSMKSAWQNMLTGMADENANFETLASNFIGTLVTEDGKGGVIGTIVPRIATVITGMSNAIQTALPQLIQSVVPIIQENLPIIMDAVSSALETILGVLPDVIPVIADLIPQIVSTLVGLLPEIIDAGIQILLGLIQGITDAIPQLVGMLPEVIDTIVTVLTDNLPLIIKTGLDLLLALTEGIINAIPKLVAQLPKIITNIVKTLLGMLPTIIDTGVKLLVALVQNMPAIISGIVKALPTLISGLINGLLSHLPEIITAGVQLLVALVQNMPAIIAGVVSAIPEIISAIVKGILDAVPQMADAGLNLIKGLWQGISDAKDWIMGKIKGFMDDIVSGIKKFFGIKSPSRLFRDQIGKNLALGIGVGFEDEMKDVTKEMQDAIPSNFDLDTSINAHGFNNNIGSVNNSAYMSMVDAFKEALYQVKIEMDDEEMGRFVDKTVTRLVFT